MILTGIRLRSALLNLWVLIEPCVESNFPSAAQRDIFRQTVALLLKYTKTAQKVNFFSDLEFFFFLMWLLIQACDSHSQEDCWPHKAASCNRGRCFPFAFPYFAGEGGVRNAEGSGWGWKSAFQLDQSGAEVVRVESMGGGVGVAVAAVQGRSRVKSKEQFLIPQHWAHHLCACRQPLLFLLHTILFPLLPLLPPLCLSIWGVNSLLGSSRVTGTGTGFHGSSGKKAGVLLRILTGSEGVCASKVEMIHYTNVFIHLQHLIILLAINCDLAWWTCQHIHIYTQVHTDTQIEDQSVREGATLDETG